MDAGGGFMKKVLKYLSYGALVLAVAFASLHLSTTPSHDRDWRVDQAVLPVVAFSGDEVTIRNVRDFRYSPGGDPVPGYYDATYDLARIESAWFVVSPFGREWRGPAHIFLSFGFDDGRYVSISVEARRPADVEYSVIGGLLNRFELIFVIGDERDVLGLRADNPDTDVYLYPVRATREQARTLFERLLQRVDSLHDEPEFYNTVTNNCTTNIVDAVNSMVAGRVPYGFGILLPGHSDELALDLALIATDLPLDEARERYRVSGGVSTGLTSEDYSRRIRID